jgi:hypothetical protein
LHPADEIRHRELSGNQTSGKLFEQLCIHALIINNRVGRNKLRGTPGAPKLVPAYTTCRIGSHSLPHPFRSIAESGPISDSNP